MAKHVIWSANVGVYAPDLTVGMRLLYLGGAGSAPSTPHYSPLVLSLYRLVWS